jgi:YfiH family protein
MHPNEINAGPVRHTFKILSGIPDLVHGVFTRHGGVSRPPYDTLNVAWNNGDSQEAVRENLARIKSTLALDRLVASPQVHGDDVHVIDETALQRAEDRPPILVAPPGDALATSLRGVGLLIKIADCQAIFLVDPVRKVIANVHCGWRGTVKELAPKVVRTLRERFGCRPRDLLATVSPSLGPCCAEFRSYRDELPPSFWPYEAKPRYFDFWAISRSQLLTAGLLPHNIEIARRCTVCEARDFFSYRGESTTGRLAAVLAWKETLG